MVSLAGLFAIVVIFAIAIVIVIVIAIDIISYKKAVLPLLPAHHFF